MTSVDVYRNKHCTPEFAEIVERGEILRTQVGSGLHGIAIEGTDDRDEMGVCIEPPAYVIGLRQFEQYQYRTQPEGGPVRCDLDPTVYSLRKFMRLALDGNPTILIALFAPEHELVRISDIGRELLLANTDRIVSREAGRRFIGYLHAQREQLLGMRPGRRHTNRPELAEKYGFDTKFAGHMVRLGVQGVELLETGRITLPMPMHWRIWIRELRQGQHTKEDALEYAADLETKLRGLVDDSALPAHPDREWADRWLTDAYGRGWDGAL